MLKLKIKNKRKSLGVTLIALVITIIVLIILAGVTISIILGENGIFNLAKNAGKNYVEAEERELSDIEKLYSSMQIATNDDAQITISISDLKTIIRNEIKESVESKNSTVSNVPAGTIISYIAGSIPPAGYLACDGTEYNISEYPNLAKAFKDGFGNSNKYGGNGTTTFKVPNLQGEFLRGTGTNSHENNGDGSNVGIHQDATQELYIASTEQGGLDVYSNGTSLSRIIDEDKVIPSSTVIGKYIKPYSDFNTVRVGVKYTARPTNTSVLYCIKY